MFEASLYRLQHSTPSVTSYSINNDKGDSRMLVSTTRTVNPATAGRTAACLQGARGLGRRYGGEDDIGPRWVDWSKRKYRLRA
jgi:hypothetical protein